MASGYGQLQFVGRDGLPFTVNMHFDGSDVVGDYVQLNPNGVAAAVDPQYCVIPGDCFLIDFIASAVALSTHGVVELISNGRRTGIMIDIDHRAVANPARPKLRIPLARGTEVRLVVVTALS